MSRKVKVCVSGETIPAWLKIPTPQAGVEIVRDYLQDFLDKQIMVHRPDLAVMTECCDRYPATSKDELYEFYEARGDAYREFFAEKAKENRCYIAYSAILKIDGVWRNATELYDREGKVAGIYLKNHLFPDEYLRDTVPGTELPLVKCDFGTVTFATCFDLNFEELRHRCRALKPDIIAFSSAFHGGLLQKMWAYESRAYFAGACARFPEILSPQGEAVAHSHNFFYSSIAAAELNLDREIIHLDYNIGKFPAIKAKYGDKVKIQTPDYLGSVLMTSESDEFTIDEIIDEFKLIRLDDYLSDCIEKREKHLKGLI